MTIGVYKLLFSNGAFYVGRSANIEKRFSTHKNDLKNNKGNKKLLSTYLEVGLPISCEILEECTSIEESLLREVYWIIKLDAINLGLNISPGGEDILQGELNPGSKYTNNQILSVLELIVKGVSLKEISENLGISYNVVRDISAGSEHLWLKEQHPELYQLMLNQRNIRKENSLANLTDKFRFKSKLSKYPDLVSPTGEVFSIGDNLSSFANKHGLHLGNLSSLINGRRKSCQKWKLR